MKKNRMKKWFVAVLILLLSFAFFACDSETPQDDDPQMPQESDTITKETAMQLYNHYSVLLFQSGGSSAENMSSLLTDALADLSFSVDNFTFNGEGYSAPDLIAFRDQTLFVMGNNYGANGSLIPYKTITKLYNGGSAVITNNGDDVSAMLNLDAKISNDRSFDVERLLEALPLKETNITETDKEGVYLLERAYIEGLVEALELSDEDVYPLGITLSQLCELTFTLDFSDYLENKRVELLVSGDALDKDISLSIDLHADDNDTARATLSLETSALNLHAEIDLNAKGIVNINVELFVGQDVNLELHYSSDENAPPLPVDTPAKDCDTTKFSLKVVYGGNEAINFIMNAAVLQDDHYAGAFSLTVNNESGAGGGIIPLSLLSQNVALQDNLNAVGEFDLSFDDNNNLVTLKCDAEIELSEASLDLDLFLDLNSLYSVGGEVATLRLRLTEISDNSVNESAVMLKLITEDYTESSASFSLSVTEEGADDPILTARIQWPASEVALDMRETEYLSRADAFFENYDALVAKINELNERAVVYVQNTMKSGAPLKYYYYDAETDQYLFTDITVISGQAYISTSCVIDYEDKLFYYASHNGTFSSYSESVAMAEAKKVQQLINESTASFLISNNAVTYAVSKYLPQYGLYLVMIAGKPETAVFYNEPISDDMVNGYVLHEITTSTGGTVDIHNFTISYDLQCNAFYRCNDCGFELMSESPMHTISADIEIRKGSDTQPRAVCSMCDRCGSGYLILTDQNGCQFKVLLSNISVAAFDGCEEYGEKDLVINGFEFVSYSNLYKGALDIPSIESQTGFRIVAVVNPDTKVFNLPEVLVLPEGLEVISHNALQGGFTSITLPSSLRIIKSKAFAYCRIKEIVIPENVTEMAGSAFDNTTLEKMTVNARSLYAFSWPSFTPNLKEIVFNGEIVNFCGTSTLTVETLVIPNGVLSVGEFNNNPYIKKVILPSTLTSIDDNAFMNCTALEEVVLPSGLQEIGYRAFSGCCALKRVWVAGTDGADSAEDGIAFPDTLISIGTYAFQRCNAVQSVRIPESITEISAGMFERCEQLVSVQIHDSVTKIGSYAFFRCNKLSDILMPESLSEIGERAFAGCVALTDENVVFGGFLQTIDALAFEDCTGIRNIRIPESIISIHASAFDGCQMDTVFVAGKVETVSLGMGCWGATVKELTLAKGFVGRFISAEIVNIMSTDVPESSSNTVHSISSAVKVINFAGTEEDFAKGNYRLDPNTQINYNVVFGEE